MVKDYGGLNQKKNIIGIKIEIWCNYHDFLYIRLNFLSNKKY